MQPIDNTFNRILVIDDTPHNLRVLLMMLSTEGYSVTCAENGMQGIELALASPPDLIMLDVTMPGMTGFEVCTRLKANPATCEAPVIFLSALDSIEDKVRAFASGGVDYITKPFHVDEVLARVQTQLALRSLQSQLRTANDELARSLEEAAHFNAELSHMNAELRTRNEELDAFAHTVAHDLKNPLGVIMLYGGMITQRGEDLSRDVVMRYVGYILESGRKMDNIIKSLLLLANVRRVNEVVAQPLEMARVVDEAQKQVVELVRGHTAQIIVPREWPKALGYEPWVEEVWVNYLSNAIKYGGKPPRIELGAEPLGAQVRFWVRDNGAGLTPDQQERLFTPFERLGQVNIEGHGLGLSVVQRIVSRLGGAVGVESTLLQGSTFYFTLPVAEHEV